VELKVRAVYRIPFAGKNVLYSCAAMGLAVFLRYICYFLLCDLDSVGAGEWILQLILPTVLCFGYLVLLHLVRLTVPLVYGALLSGIFVMLLVSDIVTCGVLQIVISALTLIPLGLLILAVTSGVFPVSEAAWSGALIVLVLRIVFGGAVSGLDQWCIRLSELSMLVSGFFFLSSLKKVSA